MAVLWSLEYLPSNFRANASSVGMAHFVPSLIFLDISDGRGVKWHSDIFERGCLKGTVQRDLFGWKWYQSTDLSQKDWRRDY
jgi:hypothetical protein